MGFELIKKDLSRRTNNKEAVRMSKSGNLLFNQATVAAYQINSYSHYLLYYDAKEQKIGIQFLRNGNLPDSRKIGSSGGYITLHTSDTIRNLEIPIPEKSVYYETYQQSELLVVDLKVPV
jgi:hypothetical protein